MAAKTPSTPSTHICCGHGTKSGCGHPLRFHGGRGACKAFGCRCKKWVKPRTSSLDNLDSAA